MHRPRLIDRGDGRRARLPGFTILWLGLAALAICFGVDPDTSYCQPASPAPAAKINGGAPVAPPQPRIIGQKPPDATIGPGAANQFEIDDTLTSLPQSVLGQYTAVNEIPSESVISESFPHTADNQVTPLSLKQAVYLAVENNPAVKSYQLDPVAATEAVRMANGVFDPDFLVTLDETKSVTPSQSVLEAKGTALSTKNYNWNFVLNKVLSTTDGALSLQFTNDRLLTNNTFVSVDPNYTSSILLSLSQPLLRNFGVSFASLSVKLAESGQLQSQWNYAQSLSDFVQQVADDYWNVVAAQENLRVAREAVKFNDDLVHDNEISVKVGTLAPISLQEARSAAATAAANAYSSEAALRTTLAQLRQDVMLNPHHAFLPQRIVPDEQPNPAEPMNSQEELSLERTVQYRPALAAMRQAVRTAHVQVRFQQNQLLPALNIVGQIGTSSLQGNVLCGTSFLPSTIVPNCIGPTGVPGFELPFKGGYNTGLSNLFNFRFYNYAVALSFEMPLDNAPIRAALAQARVAYEQARMQYRYELSRVIVETENALGNLEAAIQRVQATHKATSYAQEALHDELAQFRVGIATTHDLLQYQNSLVSAEGQEVQADVQLEEAKVELRHSDGRLLDYFQINFRIRNPREETPWYARF
ncbi:MAG: TolC family protein [Candidatus Binataceae bacterium]